MDSTHPIHASPVPKDEFDSRFPGREGREGKGSKRKSRTETYWLDRVSVCLSLICAAQLVVVRKRSTNTDMAGYHIYLNYRSSRDRQSP